MVKKSTNYPHRNPGNPDDTRRFKYPCSVKLANQINSTRYVEIDTICSNCGTKDPVRYVGTQECSFCIFNSFKEQYKSLNLDPARYTLHRRPCARGPHLRLTFTGGRKCLNCETNSLSPRQLAIQEGGDSKWYKPLTPCLKCGTLALKRIDNGRCQGCQPKGPDQRLVDHDAIIPPGTVIDRETAKTMGLNIYRTGRPCKRGHNTVRWVKGGACVGCRK